MPDQLHRVCDLSLGLHPLPGSAVRKRRLELGGYLNILKSNKIPLVLYLQQFIVSWFDSGTLSPSVHGFYSGFLLQG